MERCDSMPSHQVLAFTLGEEQYCIDIECITQVVNRSRDDLASIFRGGVLNR
ncbi:hypothetical protein SAMN05216218_1097 [Halorientalis regularis]|uniref:Uncharacterized protein n=1 Tax=Halorientalis regularis TaxID=660518 RepID=A0A1G7NHE1_9EURY|nr:hypothetical protein SAMN05216218_1097 [Halorientalis regularis]